MFKEWSFEHNRTEQIHEYKGNETVNIHKEREERERDKGRKTQQNVMTITEQGLITIAR